MTSEEMLKQVVENKASIDVHEKRINALEDTTKRIESLTLSVEKLAMSLERLTSEMSNQTSKQENLESRLAQVERYPEKTKAEQHDKVVSQVVMLVVGAIVGFLLKEFFGL